MSYSVRPLPVLRACAFRPRQLRCSHHPIVDVKSRGRRAFADEKKIPSAGQKGPNMDQQEHVSEEAAKMARIQGQEGPDLDLGTPVQEILKEEDGLRESAPKVMKEQAERSDNTGTAPSTSNSGTRTFSTMARRRLEVQPHDNTPYDPTAVTDSDQRSRYAAAAAAAMPTPDDSADRPGHKFPLPSRPMPHNANRSRRYEPIVEQLTGLLIIDGKKARAQRWMAAVLSTLRSSPAPTYSSRPLLPGAPPASHLPLVPILYLTLAIDSVAPLAKIYSIRGAAGGGRALLMPAPLALRQRRRRAFKWILDVCHKRPAPPGDDKYPVQIAQELIAIVEGRSTVWDKRTEVHKLATTSRINLNYRPRKGR